jgi:hypothetical protein
MATLTVTPNPTRVGQPVTILGADFAASTPVAVRIDSQGFFSEIASNSGGLISNDLITEHATATITAAGNPSATETVTLGGVTYTFRASLTSGGLANEVLIGGTASASLDNLKAAVNGAAGAGTTYGNGTVANPDIIAGAKNATTIVFHARLAGTAGNALASTETSATALSFGGATFTGGAADVTGFKEMDWRPTKEGTYIITATDGTNTATATVQVYTSG